MREFDQTCPTLPPEIAPSAGSGLTEVLVEE